MHQSGKNQIAQFLAANAHPFPQHAGQDGHVHRMLERIIIGMPDHQQVVHDTRRIDQWVDLLIGQFLHAGDRHLTEQADRVERRLDQIDRVFVICIKSCPII